MYPLPRALVAYFKLWRIQRLEALAARGVLPPFNPPKPSMVDGLKNLIDFFNGRMCAEDFKAGVRTAFINTGLVPNPTTGNLPLCVGLHRQPPPPPRFVLAFSLCGGDAGALW